MKKFIKHRFGCIHHSYDVKKITKPYSTKYKKENCRLNRKQNERKREKIVEKCNCRQELYFSHFNAAKSFGRIKPCV